MDRPQVKRVTPAAPVTPIDWKKPDATVLESAQAGDKPILIFFAGESEEQNSAGYMNEPSIKDLVDAKAIFVKVPYTSDKEKAPSTDSPVPVSRLLSDNPTRDYDVRSYPTFVVADKFGNEYFRIQSKKPQAKELEALFEQVAGKAEDASKKLQKHLDAANKAWGQKDRANALKSVLRVFKEGYVGLSPVEPTVRLYNEILEDARAEIKRLRESNDMKGLKALKAVLRGTEAEKEVDEALAGPSNTSK